MGYSLGYGRFPWFRDASMRDVLDVRLEFGVHLRWPSLDVDARRFLADGIATARDCGAKYLPGEDVRSLTAAKRGAPARVYGATLRAAARAKVPTP